MDPKALVDLHCDTLTAFMAPDRCSDTLDDPQAALSLSKLPRGVDWCQCFAVFVPDGLPQEEAAAYYRRHRDSFFRQMDHFAPRVAPCRTADHIRLAWQAGKTAAVLTVENGAALGGSLSMVEELARDGVKLITLTWNAQNEIAAGASAEGGLSPFGRRLIPALEEANIFLDVSHLSDQSFWEAAAASRAPLVASHSNARAVCPHRRNLTDDQIRLLVERGGLIGLNYYTYFLREDGQPQPEDLWRHVEHFLELGAENCLALGSDFDGADLPPWLSGPEQAAGLYGLLREHGLSAGQCDKILWGNALAFFQKNFRGS